MDHIKIIYRPTTKNRSRLIEYGPFHILRNHKSYMGGEGAVRGREGFEYGINDAGRKKYLKRSVLIT